MVKDLASDQERAVATLKEAFGVAQNAGDEVTIGLVTDRMTVHEKNAWMLRSSI